MTKSYLEAAGKLDELAEEFSDNVEIFAVLKSGSFKIIQKAVEKGGLYKTASQENTEQDS